MIFFMAFGAWCVHHGQAGFGSISFAACLFGWVVFWPLLDDLLQATRARQRG